MVLAGATRGAVSPRPRPWCCCPPLLKLKQRRRSWRVVRRQRQGCSRGSGCVPDSAPHPMKNPAPRRLAWQQRQLGQLLRRRASRGRGLAHAPARSCPRGVLGRAPRRRRRRESSRARLASRWQPASCWLRRGAALGVTSGPAAAGQAASPCKLASAASRAVASSTQGETVGDTAGAGKVDALPFCRPRADPAQSRRGSS